MTIKKRYLIEIGIGVDMHGGDMTGASVKAVKNAMSHCCMAGIHDIHGCSAKDVALKIKLACPKPEQVNTEEVRALVGFYDDVEISVEAGGCSEKGLYVKEMGEGDDLTVAVAVITVYLKLQ